MTSISHRSGSEPGHQTQRGPSSLTEFEVSLVDMYKGASIDVSLSHFIIIQSLTLHHQSLWSRNASFATTVEVLEPHPMATYTRVPAAMVQESSL